MFRHWDDEGFTTIVGPARNANLIEVGYVLSDEGQSVRYTCNVDTCNVAARPKYPR